MRPQLWTVSWSVTRRGPNYSGGRRNSLGEGGQMRVGECEGERERGRKREYSEKDLTD